MGLCQSRKKGNGIYNRGRSSSYVVEETNSKMITDPPHDNDVAQRKKNTGKRKRPAPKPPGHGQGINQASLINQPKGHQAAHFNQGRATLPAPDVTTKSSPTRPISEPAKQTQGLQENRSDAMTTDSSTTDPKKTKQSQTINKAQPVNTPEIVQIDQKYSKRERAHASDKSKSCNKNSQNRRNKMMNSSPLDDPNAYETKPNFSSPDQNVQIAKTDECTQNTEKDAQNRHNYDANKGGTSSAHTYHGAANSAILEGQQNSENAIAVFSNKIDERGMYFSHDNDVAQRKKNTGKRKRPAPKPPGHGQGINQASLINQPKGHQAAHFNQGSATLPAPDVTTKSSPTRPISEPVKQTQGLQENRSDAMTTDSSTTDPKKTKQSQTINKAQPVNTPEIVQIDQKYSKRERAHASDKSKSCNKNSQNRRNKMMNSSPLDDPNAYETKPNFSSPDQNVQIAKTHECTQNTEKDAQNRHNYDANKGGTSSAHTYHGAANSAILEGQQNSENAIAVFSNKIDERESNVTLETNSNLTISTRQEPCNAIIGVTNWLSQLSEAEMERKIELNSLDERINKLKIEIENYRDGKGHTRYYYLDDQVLKLMYKVDDVKLDKYSPLRKNKLQLSKDLDQLEDLLKTKA